MPHANSEARYDPVRDFKPVANLFRSVKALWVPAALPAASLKDFVRYASARPGALNFATGGVGSSNHIDAALFTTATKASTSSTFPTTGRARAFPRWRAATRT